VSELLTPFASLELADVAICQAQALFALGEHRRVVELLEPLGARLRNAMSMAMSRDELRDIDQQQRELTTLYDDAYAACHGRERVIESPLLTGQLDARSGVNYRLLGEARMARPPGWKPDPTLRSVADSITFGQGLIAQGERSRGLCHLGAAHLRGGDLDKARDHFERAREADDHNFAAYLGIGAVLDYDQHRCRAKVGRLFLPAGVEVPALVDVVVDWAALTDEERRAVTAAALPLASLLPKVAEHDGQARILPIDARPVDLAVFAAEAGERDDWDQRCLDAITGVATPEMCVAKVESLLDIGSLGGWVFAHELAHLAHFHAPEAVQQRIEDLYQQLGEEDYLLTTYETKNSAEFFAVAYVDYLDRRWELPTTRELDTDGLLGEVFAFFDELGPNSPG
jgi:tetratricopeptide (TPR) repeat protein